MDKIDHWERIQRENLSVSKVKSALSHKTPSIN